MYSKTVDVSNSSQREQSFKRKFAEVKAEKLQLQFQLESFNEVISKIKLQVSTEEKYLENKLEEIWNNSLSFLEELNNFNDTKGVSSTWWNNQILSLQNPDILQNGSSRRQQKIQLHKALQHVNELQCEIASGEEQVSKLKEKIQDKAAQILEMKRIEEELTQEPFGAEFASVKEKIQRSRELCLQLGALAANRNEGRGNMVQSQNQRVSREFYNDVRGFNISATSSDTNFLPFQAEKGNTVDLNKGPKIFRFREKTKLVYRRQVKIPRSEHSNIGNDIPTWEDNFNDNEPDVTHS